MAEFCRIAFRWSGLLVLCGGLLSCVDTSKVKVYSCTERGDCQTDPNNQGADSGVDQIKPCQPACQPGLVCVDGACMTPVGNGVACTSGAMCESGFCTDGVCCEKACNGACESCAQATAKGVCKPYASGDESEKLACGAYLCSGTSGACPSNCDSSRDCSDGFVCNAQKNCVPKQPVGVACVDSIECGSGFCVDGVCCESVCAGSCDSCNQPAEAGRCKPLPQGNAGTPICGGGVVCNGSAADCPIPCLAGSTCKDTSTYCRTDTNLCAAKRDNGTACTAALECKSGNCVDGVCCNSACGGACDACSAALGASKDGVCSFLSKAVRCRTAADVCDADDYCSGASADCPANGVQPAGTTCRAAASGCDVAEQCNGTAASCPADGFAAVATACPNGVCNGGGVCNACSAGQTCDANACQTGKTSCATGTSTCVADANKSAGTACPGGVCNGQGGCNACNVGTSCNTGNACTTGTTVCSTGAPTCPPTANVANGSACPGGVCKDGVCNGCAAGTGCNPSNDCQTGAIDCSSGAPVCAVNGNKGAGAACAGGTCNGSGTCVACVAGGACDTGNPCSTGAIDCSSGSPQCVPMLKPVGTACMGGVCNSSGVCTACNAGSGCTPANPCKTGAISCSMGAPVCVDTGNVPAGTSCGNAYQQCDGAGNCQCTGCVTTAGACASGETEAACGSSGGTCKKCGTKFYCNAGMCELVDSCRNPPCPIP